MNSLNASTGYSGFQLRLGFSPRLLPPISQEPVDENAETPVQFLCRMERDVGSAVDNLVASKIEQADQANRYRMDDVAYAIGDKVLLSSKFLNFDELNLPLPPTRKLRPRFVGLFTVTAVDSRHSTVTLDLPGDSSTNIEPDQDNIPDVSVPPSKSTSSGVEHFIRDILEHKRSGRGFRFLVWWGGFPESHNEWKTYSELNHTKALDEYLAKNGPLT